MDNNEDVFAGFLSSPEFALYMQARGEIQSNEDTPLHNNDGQQSNALTTDQQEVCDRSNLVPADGQPQVSVADWVCMLKIDEPSVSVVKELLGLRMTMPQIAKELGCSKQKVRYMVEKNHLNRKKFVNINDAHLDEMVSLLIQHYPKAGHKALIGLYAGLNMPVCRERLRSSINRIRTVRLADPPRRTIIRRQYFVKAPLTMLHIDGHHKLIRWRFVVHGGIDGYSRLITFLKLSTNNKAGTVLKHFREGVLTWGLPVAVRSDRGLENVGVADFMLAARQDSDTNPFITGRSVHNQRIERLWRDVFEIALHPYYIKFREMEFGGILNPSCDVDIFCLHKTCSELLSKTVDGFQVGWNNHPISTVNNRTPRQLFVSGLLQLRRGGGFHAELCQDANQISFAERESSFLSNFNAAGRRPGLVNVEPFLSPLTAVEEEHLNLQLVQQDVSLDTITPTYINVKAYVMSCVSRRVGV